MRTEKIYLRVAVGTIIIILSFLAIPLYAAKSIKPPVVPAEQLWNEYLANPNTHPNIPNNSYAGYHYGEKAIPDVPVVVNAADFGAIGDGKTDAGEAINKALKAASEKGGGAVLLPPGTYCLSSVLFMHYSNVVLRGAGMDQTELYFTKPLNQCYYVNKNKKNESAWSNSGGLIWFAPFERNNINTRGNSSGGWVKTQTIGYTKGNATRGAEQLEVVDGSKFKAGQRIIIYYPNKPDRSLQKMLAGNIEGADKYNWNNKGARVSNYNLRIPIEIAKVDGNILTLRQPLRFPTENGYEIRTIGQVIEEAGIEDLTIRMPPCPGDMERDHCQDVGFNGLCFQCAWNCWARRVRINNWENGVIINSSKNNTIENVILEGKGKHFSFMAHLGSADNLITKFTIESRFLHGLNLEYCSGNVYSVGEMKHGTFDYHRAIAHENILTDITLHNDGVAGGADATSGPRFGARNVFWNIRVTNGRPHMVNVPQLMPYGVVVGVQGCKKYATDEPLDYPGDVRSVVAAPGEQAYPVNLHLAQLEARLGYLPEHFKN